MRIAYGEQDSAIYYTLSFFAEYQNYFIFVSVVIDTKCSFSSDENIN